MRCPRGNVAESNIAYCNSVAIVQHCSAAQRDNPYVYDRGYSVELGEKMSFPITLALKLLNKDLVVPFQY